MNDPVWWVHTSGVAHYFNLWEVEAGETDAPSACGRVTLAACPVGDDTIPLKRRCKACQRSTGGWWVYT